MDGPLPSQQSDNTNLAPQEKKTSNALFFEIIFIVVLLVLVFGTLSYFNIIPLSKFLPQQKSSLIIDKNPQTSTPFKINCPTIKEFCYNWQEIIKDYKFLGLGYKLSTGSAIFAAFDGNLSATKSTFSTEIEGKIVEKRFNILSLDNPSLNFRATYFLRGDIIKIGKVSKGEQIATANGNQISIYDNSSLVFSLFFGSPDTNTPIILNTNYFD